MISDAALEQRRLNNERQSLKIFNQKTAALPLNTPITYADFLLISDSKQLSHWKAYNFIAFHHKEGRRTFYIIPERRNPNAIL